MNNIYGFFKWDKTSFINECSPESLISAHNIKDSEQIYFITLNGKPFFIVRDKTENEILKYVADLELAYEENKEKDENENEYNIDEIEITDEELANILINN